MAARVMVSLDVSILGETFEVFQVLLETYLSHVMLTYAEIRRL